MDNITLRDYFAAHAPAEPTFVFVVKMATERPKVKFTSAKHPGVVFMSEGEMHRQCNYPSNEMHYMDFQDENHQARREWDEERDRQRFIQWPWVWADAVLAGQGRG